MLERTPERVGRFLDEHATRALSESEHVQALKLLESTNPDLIVLDLMLPGRSGLDLLGEIRGVGGHERTPIVVISAWAHSDEAAVAAGADRFVAKPFDPDELNTTIADLLESDGHRG